MAALKDAVARAREHLADVRDGEAALKKRYRNPWRETILSRPHFERGDRFWAFAMIEHCRIEELGVIPGVKPKSWLHMRKSEIRKYPGAGALQNAENKLAAAERALAAAEKAAECDLAAAQKM